jgi:hypothetical protein
MIEKSEYRPLKHTIPVCAVPASLTIVRESARVRGDLPEKFRASLQHETPFAGTLARRACRASPDRMLASRQNAAMLRIKSLREAATPATGHET